MNWRRGLLRLWIVLSICWIAAIAAISVSDIIDRWQSADAAAKLAESAYIDEETGEVRVTTRFGDAALASEPQPPATELERDIVDLNRRLAEARIQGLNDEAERKIRRRNQTTIFFGGLALGPPILALVIGSALLWAVSGFRQRQ